MFKSVANTYKQSKQHGNDPYTRKLVYAALLVSVLFMSGLNFSTNTVSAFILCSLGFGAATWPNSLMSKIGKKIGFFSLLVILLSSYYVLGSLEEYYPTIMTEKAKDYLAVLGAGILLMYLFSRTMFFYHFVVHHIGFRGSKLNKSIKFTGLSIIALSFIIAPLIAFVVLYPYIVLTIMRVVCNPMFFDVMANGKTSSEFDDDYDINELSNIQFRELHDQI